MNPTLAATRYHCTESPSSVIVGLSYVLVHFVGQYFYLLELRDILSGTVDRSAFVLTSETGFIN